MGEKFMDIAFQNDILKAMICRLINAGRNPNIETINYIYCGTTDPSPARRFMIDTCIWTNRGCLEDIENPAVQLHEDLVRDLLKASMALPKPLSPETPWDLGASNYFKQILRK
ncbi:hypothetical protein CC86DRAFT_369395 [Ophiobolus disseminans]|uniref:Uncharacterized protein n=1 Tax=Ophiobolus disseminans TaxID=1469910 RepID=A0A6A7A1J7_9PLEO|nr:hypothetical protein CC86DRAFT_369395 [Ophiobolus disseminans]